MSSSCSETTSPTRSASRNIKRHHRLVPPPVRAAGLPGRQQVTALAEAEPGPRLSPRRGRAGRRGKGANGSCQHRRG
jgi:hypothetical protein